MTEEIVEKTEEVDVDTKLSSDYLQEKIVSEQTKVEPIKVEPVKVEPTKAEPTDKKSNAEQAVKTEVERIASDMGWQNPEKFKKNELGKNYVDAEEYIKTADNIKETQGITIENLKGEIKRQTAAIKMLYKYQSERVKIEVDKKMKDLELKKTAAIQEGDISEVKSVESEMSEIQKELKLTKPKEDTDDIDTSELETLNKWKKENPWYDSKSPDFDENLYAMAQGIANDYDKDTPIDDVLTVISRRMKSFVEKGKTKPTEPKTETTATAVAVADGNSPDNSKRILTFNDLNLEQQEVYNTMKKTMPSGFDGGKLIKDWQETGVIE